MKIILTIIMFLCILFANAQLNLSLSYSNQSILYDAAQGLNGFEMDVLYKFKPKRNLGLSFRYNQEITNRHTDVYLQRQPNETCYKRIYNSWDYTNLDSNSIVKKFNGRNSYIYLSIAFKNLFELKNNHSIGYSIGVNVLGEQNYLEADSITSNYFYKRASMPQIMLGFNYQRELKMKKTLYFVYGCNFNVSAMPIKLPDANFIYTPLVGLSGTLGIRCCFSELKENLNIVK